MYNKEFNDLIINFRSIFLEKDLIIDKLQQKIEDLEKRLEEIEGRPIPAVGIAPPEGNIIHDYNEDKWDIVLYGVADTLYIYTIKKLHNVLDIPLKEAKELVTEAEKLGSAILKYNITWEESGEIMIKLNDLAVSRTIHRKK